MVVVMVVCTLHNQFHLSINHTIRNFSGGNDENATPNDIRLPVSAGRL
jgi:hypothetical protein